MQSLLALVPTLKMIALVAYPVLEWWLGRTNTLKANSLIDVVLNLVNARLGKK